jgi:hypothetical protein
MKIHDAQVGQRIKFRVDVSTDGTFVMAERNINKVDKRIDAVYVHYGDVRHYPLDVGLVELAT